MDSVTTNEHTFSISQTRSVKPPPFFASILLLLSILSLSQLLHFIVYRYLDSDPVLPLEFALLGYTPEPWEPADTLVWMKVIEISLLLVIDLPAFYLVFVLEDEGLQNYASTPLVPAV